MKMILKFIVITFFLFTLVIPAHTAFKKREDRIPKYNEETQTNLRNIDPGDEDDELGSIGDAYGFIFLLALGYGYYILHKKRKRESA
jgi:hypothetical protein